MGRPRGDVGYFGRRPGAEPVGGDGGLPGDAGNDCTEVGELDEQDLEVAFNDIDLCLRIRRRSYRIVWTPYAELYHHESATRGSDLDPDQIERFHSEVYQMKRRWGATLQNDPYYNPNLRLEAPEFRLAFPPRVTKPWHRA